MYVDHRDWVTQHHGRMAVCLHVARGHRCSCLEDRSFRTRQGVFSVLWAISQGVKQRFSLLGSWVT